MRTNNNLPVTLAFIITAIAFLLLCGAAIMITLINSDTNKSGFMDNISWIWVPTIITLLISGLLGWSLVRKSEV
ncbi:MAG: hypothetical protein HY965_08360 [Ignavibacteriales bacterium]|nr:hypothetical protein [Ignavibacteriales bacterium]